MKMPELISTGFDRYSCPQTLHSRTKPDLTRWSGILSSFKKSTLLVIGLVIMLTGCGGSSDSVNYSSVNYSLNYSDYTGPYFQAIDFSRNLVTEADTSVPVVVTYSYQEDTFMPDSRNGFSFDNAVSAHFFNATYNDGPSIIFVVNPEFGDQAAAETEVTLYAEVIGRIPVFLRSGISTVNLHKADEPLVRWFSGLIIYSFRANYFSGQGILEEVLIHESAHVSLDTDLAASSDWLSAQNNDGQAISQLANDLSYNEDAAESLLAYIAVQYRANRLAVSVENSIRAAIPNRIDYFNTLSFDMSPIVQDQPGDWDNATAPVSSWQHPSLFAYYEQWEQTVILF